MGEDFPAQPPGFRPGSLVAGYRLEAQAGTVGMAVVFRARDQRLDRLVALKILLPWTAADGELRQRFIAESRAAAAVDHPHIIPIYDAGEADGLLFIAMRFVQGGDLWRVLEREGPLLPGRAAEFISPVASALDAAHREGLVHRDVKPGNILVDARPDEPDHVYLSDFGICKGAMSSVSLTSTGQFLGTPVYSAPEQFQGRAVDGRTDQYTLACVAYQLLTGTAPFNGDNYGALRVAHLNQPPPSVSSRRPDLPGASDRVLVRAMAKIMEDRYMSCQDFAEALREALGLPPYHSRSPVLTSQRPLQPVVPQLELSRPIPVSTSDSARSGDRSASREPSGPSGPRGPDRGRNPPRSRGSSRWSRRAAVTAAAAAIAVVTAVLLTVVLLTQATPSTVLGLPRPARRKGSPRGRLRPACPV